jgi:hypothetical protein
MGDTSLKTITVPNSVKTIKERAFKDSAISRIVANTTDATLQSIKS